MALFRRLATETAHLWKFAYPAGGDQGATDLVGQLLAGYEGVALETQRRPD